MREAGSPLDGVRSLLASWALGELDTHGAVIAVCRALDEFDATCGIVMGGEVIGGERAAATSAALVTLAKDHAGKRVLRTNNDASWGEVSARAGIGDAVWFVCEPLEAGASMVLVGASDHARDPLLIALPRVAHAVRSLIAALPTTAPSRAEVLHRLRNAVAALVANIEYAADIVEQRRETDDFPTDLGEALHHAQTSVDRIAEVAEALARPTRG